MTVPAAAPAPAKPVTAPAAVPPPVMPAIALVVLGADDLPAPAGEHALVAVVAGPGGALVGVVVATPAEVLGLPLEVNVDLLPALVDGVVAGPVVLLVELVGVDGLGVAKADALGVEVGRGHVEERRVVDAEGLAASHEGEGAKGEGKLHG